MISGRRLVPVLLLCAAAGSLPAQWTVQPHGWFLSVTADKGTIPDRFDPGVGAISNGLDKVDGGIYFVYGLRDGLTLGLGQGFAHLVDNHDGTAATTTGFGATGLFAIQRIAQGKFGVLSFQPRIDMPLLYDINARPVLGPIKSEGELRLLYGTGYGIAKHRGWMSASVGVSPWRHGNSEIRYDATIGLDAGRGFTLIAQAFNVIGLGETGQAGIAYSATKIGGSAVYHVSPSLGIVAGYYAGVSGLNTARERTGSLGLWITHAPKSPPPSHATGQSP